MRHRFYDLNIDTPQSIFNNTSGWDDSVIGKLHAQTLGQVFIREIPYEYFNRKMPPQYGWRVVDAKFSQEDGLMTYFRAFGLDGELLPQATFGVNFSPAPRRIAGGFRFPPAFNCYYLPQGGFPTPNTGGYMVEILDLKNPSESLAFGMYMQGEQHQCLRIDFRLFELGDGYPNDR